MKGGRPRIYETPDELETAIDAYFEGSERDEITITGLALYLGFESRQSLYDYEKDPRFSYIIKRAKLRVEMNYEMRLNSNSCTGAIFALKNMGWRDKTEVEQSGGLVITWNEERTYETK
jgi:hypothetical protein